MGEEEKQALTFHSVNLLCFDDRRHANKEVAQEHENINKFIWWHMISLAEAFVLYLFIG